MTRHKSRVARRSRRRARRGTRKQSGGWLFGLFGSKPDAAPAVDATAAAADTEPAQSASFWDNFNPFKSKKPQPEVISAAAQNTNPPPPPPPPAAAAGIPPPVGAVVNVPSSVSEQGGGRKTRHRRSPRRHRK